MAANANEATDDKTCLFCAEEMDLDDPRAPPCVRLQCPGCGCRTYHKDCIATYLRRYKWHADGVRAGAGLAGFVCPRGKGKLELDEKAQCKCKITGTTLVVVKGAKAEQKKAAKVAALAQLQEQLKQQQAQKRAAQQAAKPQQQQKQQQQQQQQQQWQPRASPVAAIPQVPAALSARLAGPEQHEVPGMEFVPQKKPKARKRGAQGAAPGPATVAGPQGSQRAQGRAGAAGQPLITAAAAGPKAQLSSNNWVHSLDAYNKLLAQLGGGSSDDEDDNNHSQQQQQQQMEGQGQQQGGDWAQSPSPTWDDHGGDTLGFAEVEDEEDYGYAALQSVVGVLTALGVEVPLGSHSSPDWLQQVMEGLEQLEEQGYDVIGFKETVLEQMLLCSGGGDAGGGSRQSSNGGGWNSTGSMTTIQDQQQQLQHLQLDHDVSVESQLIDTSAPDAASTPAPAPAPAPGPATMTCAGVDDNTGVLSPRFTPTPVNPTALATVAGSDTATPTRLAGPAAALSTTMPATIAPVPNALGVVMATTAAAAGMQQSHLAPLFVPAMAPASQHSVTGGVDSMGQAAAQPLLVHHQQQQFSPAVNPSAAGTGAPLMPSYAGIPANTFTQALPMPQGAVNMAHINPMYQLMGQPMQGPSLFQPFQLSPQLYSANFGFGATGMHNSMVSMPGFPLLATPGVGGGGMAVTNTAPHLPTLANATPQQHQLSMPWMWPAGAAAPGQPAFVAQAPASNALHFAPQATTPHPSPSLPQTRTPQLQPAAGYPPGAASLPPAVDGGGRRAAEEEQDGDDLQELLSLCLPIQA